MRKSHLQRTGHAHRQHQHSPPTPAGLVVEISAMVIISRSKRSWRFFPALRAAVLSGIMEKPAAAPAYRSGDDPPAAATITQIAYRRHPGPRQRMPDLLPWSARSSQWPGPVPRRRLSPAVSPPMPAAATRHRQPAVVGGGKNREKMHRRAHAHRQQERGHDLGRKFEWYSGQRHQAQG